MIFCRYIKEVHNSLEWNITKIYLFGDQTHSKGRDLWFSMGNWSWEPNPAKKGPGMLFVYIYSTSDDAQMGRQLKGF